jgi:hypothetical protein
MPKRVVREAAGINRKDNGGNIEAVDGREQSIRGGLQPTALDHTQQFSKF